MNFNFFHFLFSCFISLCWLVVCCCCLLNSTTVIWKKKRLVRNCFHKTNTPPLLVQVQTSIAALEISMGCLRKLENSLPQYSGLTIMGTYHKMLNHTSRTCAQLCSWQHYLFHSRTWKNLDAPQLKNG